MMITSTASHTYGYGFSQPSSENSLVTERNKDVSRQTYGSQLLEKMDDRAYRAFENATANDDSIDKKLYAKALEKTVARSAADQYALVHDVNKANEVEVVYAFFDTYHDVVSTEEIKHLLNVRLQNNGHLPDQQSKIENFFNDYIAQLGGIRSLDIIV